MTEIEPAMDSEIGELIAALSALRKPARLLAAESASRTARASRRAAEHELQQTMARARDERPGHVRPTQHAADLARALNDADDCAKASRAGVDAERNLALPAWLSQLSALEPRAAALLQVRVSEIRTILDAMSAAARFMADQRQPAPPLIALGPRLAAALTTIEHHLAASARWRGDADA